MCWPDFSPAQISGLILLPRLSRHKENTEDSAQPGKELINSSNWEESEAPYCTLLMCLCEFLYRFEGRIVLSCFLLFTSILISSSSDQLQLVLSKAILNILYKFNCRHEFFKNRHTKMIVVSRQIITAFCH